MPDIPEGLIPARYVGNLAVNLGEGVDCYNLDGSKRREPSLEYGDELLMKDEDILGKTLWHDPRHQKPSLFLGLGRVVLPGDENKSSEELGLIGYEFHMRRNDFVPLEVPDTVQASPESQGTTMTFEVDSDAIEEVSEDAQAAESEKS